MGFGAETLPNEAQPRDTGVCGFSDRPLHIKMEYRFRTASTFFGEPPPAGVAPTRCAIACRAITNEINVNIFIRRPMVLEVVEKFLPVG